MSVAVGTKAMVWHGTARHTSGGLTKKDLMKHHGRIISRKKHAAGKKAIKHLFALGYKPKKGTFKIMRKSMRKARKSRKRRGGSEKYEEEEQEHEQEHEQEQEQ